MPPTTWGWFVKIRLIAAAIAAFALAVSSFGASPAAAGVSGRCASSEMQLRTPDPVPTTDPSYAGVRRLADALVICQGETAITFTNRTPFVWTVPFDDYLGSAVTNELMKLAPSNQRFAFFHQLDFGFYVLPGESVLLAAGPGLFGPMEYHIDGVRTARWTAMLLSEEFLRDAFGKGAPLWAAAWECAEGAAELSAQLGGGLLTTDQVIDASEQATEARAECADAWGEVKAKVTQERVKAKTNPFVVKKPLAAPKITWTPKTASQLDDIIRLAQRLWPR